MKITLFITILLSLISIKAETEAIHEECEPRNIYITIHEDYSDPTTNRPSLRVGFHSKRLCITSTVLKIEYKDEIFTYNFLFSSTHISKIFDEIKSDNYIRYAYLSEPIVFDHEGQFDYKIYTNYDSDPVLIKELTYKSNITNIKAGTKIRIMTYGDQPLNENTKEVVDAYLREEFDLIILLGDVANMINDDYGEKGDKFFDMLEPLITRAPVLMTPGNRDMSDNSNLFNFRFRFGTNMLASENNIYVINLKNISFFFFNLDYYYYKDFISKDITRRWLIDKLDEIQNILKPDFKVLVTHKPFRCLNKQLKEGCHKDVEEKYDKIEEVISRYNFDLHLASHINQYQRFKNTIFQTKYHTLTQYWDVQSFTPTTVITGTGGFVESDTDFEGEIPEDIEKIDIKVVDNAVGYTVLKLDYPLKEIGGEFIKVDNSKSVCLDPFIIPYRENKTLSL